MLRQWIFSTLTGHTDLTDIVGDRIWLATSLTDIPQTKPFLIYRLGIALGPLRGDGRTKALDRPLQLFAHDDVGDYQRLDDMLKMCRELLDGGSSKQHGVTACEWFEDSEDLRDDEFHTNVRYSRYQIKITP